MKERKKRVLIRRARKQIAMNTQTKIEFQILTPDFKETYDRHLAQGQRECERECERGCEFSFANVYLWGRQRAALLHDHIVIFSQFNRRSVYPFPLGEGDKRAVIDAIIADAQARGIPCRITGLVGNEKQLLEDLYPGRFRFHCDRGAYDYVYDIHDLADLKGKKYHGKRNHCHRFLDAYPNYAVEPISDENMPAVLRMVDRWFDERMAADAEGDYHMERAALTKALRDREALQMDGLALRHGEEVLAMTLGSRLSSDTFDVQFEKARADAEGAYPMINREFARYLREKYPELRFLNREEDMGLEGLRRAKESYQPHHMVEKCWACLLEDGYDY